MTAWAITIETPLPYADGVRLQTALVDARIAGTIPDTILFLEHTSVITLGVRARDSHVLLSSADLEQRRIDLYRSSRGGDVTWHGPGQLVMYPIIRLGEQEADAHGYLHNLEEIAIRTAGDFGVAAYRRPKLTGAWTRAGKLAAIGIRLKRWVTFHGMSFNVNPDLAGFAAIVPCGLAGEAVVSLEKFLGAACPALAQVRQNMARHFSEVCRRGVQWAGHADRLPVELGKILKMRAP
ncbi:MAG: lipoyl(octanoyl) transferase LipB [Kiritimatiellia bacterium]|jgi:lipoate-protein ligase B